MRPGGLRPWKTATGRKAEVAIGVFEDHALAGQTLKVGGEADGVAIGSQDLGRQLVGLNEKDVRLVMRHGITQVRVAGRSMVSQSRACNDVSCKPPAVKRSG